MKKKKPLKNVVNSSSVTAFDCDDTLVLWPRDYKQYKPGRIQFEYGSEIVYLIPHSYHVIFLKHCFNRGDHVIVWSANGHAWATQVVEKLKLTNHYSVIMSKPTRHVDDKESIASVAGSRVFIPHETYDGAK